MRREGSRREYREAAGAVAEGMTPSTMSGSLISDLSNVTGAGRGVGVGFRWSSKVPHFGFWLTVECLFVDGGSVNRRGEIRPLQRVRDRIPTCLTNDCVVNLKAITPF